MRVLVAPDAFAGTLTAVQAAEAIATGWQRRSPASEVDRCPMSDGGPGFVGVLHASLGGELLATTVSGPHGVAVPASVLRVGDTAYIESAQACGLHLAGHGEVEDASTYGVGELVAAARDSGATRIIVGLGGSGTNDGGAGLLAALGATGSAPLDAGSRPLADLTSLDLAPARDALEGVEL
ncbi:MAG: glycerate kinase, partial [Pseudonocardia sp.]